jgi:hypothetical protein
MSTSDNGETFGPGDFDTKKGRARDFAACLALAALTSRDEQAPAAHSTSISGPSISSDELGPYGT